MLERLTATTIVVLVALLPVVPAGAEEPGPQPPSWMLELKGGQFEPDLDDYDTFYGSDHTSFGALALAYRLSHRVELGGELGYFEDEGTGQLLQNELLGGSTTYKLMPLQAFVNVRGEFWEDQLFVPYAGVGLAMAFYQHKIDGQSDRNGNTDLGYSARLGVALSFNRLDPRTVRAAAGSVAATPVRLRELERTLEGAKIDENLAERAAAACRSDATPIDDVRSTAAYRTWALARVVRRMILNAQPY